MTGADGVVNFGQGSDAGPIYLHEFPITDPEFSIGQFGSFEENAARFSRSWLKSTIKSKAEIERFEALIDGFENALEGA